MYTIRPLPPHPTTAVQTSFLCPTYLFCEQPKEVHDVLWLTTELFAELLKDRETRTKEMSPNFLFQNFLRDSLHTSERQQVNKQKVNNKSPHRVLGGDSDGAGVEVALSHHDATQGDEGRG